MFKNIIAYFTLLFFMVSCATAYRGPNPNFSLKGEEAQKEISDFSMEENYWSQNLYAVELGKKATLYTYESVKPIVAEVSPEAIKKIDKADTVHTVGLVLLGLALGLAIGEASTGNGSISDDGIIAYYSLLGLSIGSSFYVPSVLSDAKKQYNQDLKNKFVPAVTLNTNF